MMNDAGEPEHARPVREYYDHNTERFLCWGKDDGTGNLHAALWPPEIASLAEAMNYSNELLDTYRRNWLLPGLRDFDTLQSLAAAQGFRLVKHQDLTTYLRICRPRDRTIALLVRLLGRRMKRATYLRALASGDAKQKCDRAGLIRYRLLVFENLSTDAGR